jgi:GNAT superfamily N-acetyltransferase
MKKDRDRDSAMTLTIHPLTPDLWPALEDLFGENGACNGCWCMYWRIGTAYRTRPRAQNKEAFREVVRRGPPPGLLAFDGAIAVGWCQFTPRDSLPWLDRVWRLKRGDDVPVWSLSCFYVRKGYRKRGVTSALIAAALAAARRAGAPALEASPLDADLTPSASGAGYASTFPAASVDHTEARNVASSGLNVQAVRRDGNRPGSFHPGRPGRRCTSGGATRIEGRFALRPGFSRVSAIERGDPQAADQLLPLKSKGSLRAPEFGSPQPAARSQAAWMPCSLGSPGV